MKGKLKKKIVWDEHGVSEIIADILILLMTVVLFSMVFGFVYSLPAPNEATYADFEADIDLYTIGDARINVTHDSGEDLYKSGTELYLYKNAGTSSQEVRRLTTKGSPGPYGDNPTGYGLLEDDSTWSPGEIWTYYMSGVTSSDDLEIKIIDTNFQTLIMATKLLGAGVDDAPIIMERWYSPSPAANASTLTIYARVMDPDGFDDISSPGSVYANVSALNSSLDFVDFEVVSNTDKIGIFKREIVVNKGQGSYTLTIIAKDSSGLMDRGRISIGITYTALNAPKILGRWSNPEVGVNGTDITIYARVEDLDGYDNLDYVTVDIAPLTDPNYNGTPNIVNMVDPEQDGRFEYSTIANVARGDLYRVNFTALDITGLQDNAHLNVSVSKFNPVISRMWTVPTTGKDDGFMTIYAEVSDPDGYSDIMEVMVNLTALKPTLGWESMLDPEKDGIFEINLTINVSTGGNKTVLFLARDMTGNEVNAQMKVFISTLNTPVILNRWTDPNFPDNNSQLSIFASVMDPDGYDDIDYVRVNITALNRTLNGSAGWVEMIDPNQDGSFYNISWVNQEAGTYLLEFEAADKGGNIGYATLNLTILPYRPRFLNVWTNPTIGRNGSSIQIFANIMDPNGYADIANVTVDIVRLNQSLNQSQSMWMEMIDFNRNGTFLNITTINVNESGLYSINVTAMDKSGNIAIMNHQLLVTSYKPT
ncbi:MAG: type IV pilin N-terminal domain-containing protein, partial [Thermoplasmata archaeon]